MASREFHTSKAPSQRQLRVAEQVRHILAEIFMQEPLYQEDMSSVSVTVSEVRMSHDLKNATVFAAPLGQQATESFIAAIQEMAPFLRHELGKRAKLRFTPHLMFKIDTSFDEAKRVSDLLSDE